MKKLLFFITLSFGIFLNSGQAWADFFPRIKSSPGNLQDQKLVSGIVTDSNGEPIPGVTVVVKGTTNGITTNTSGEFSINVGINDKVLVISFVGMKTVEVDIPVGNKPFVNVALETDVFEIQDVIVTAYGTYKKSAFAGSVSSVKTETLKDVPTSNLAQLLSGSTTGVQVTSSSGQPGAAYNIRIRGLGSFNASNFPLYVIDGMPVSSGNYSSLGSSPGFDIMSTINPSDIESINVIKDASAASLYGSRAANGVILIRTKTGKEGKTKFNYKVDFGSTDFAMQYRSIMRGAERRAVLWEGLYNQAAMLNGLDDAAACAFADSNIDTYAPIPWNGYNDWDKMLFRKGKHQNHEFSASGGTKVFTHYSSLSYTKQEGISYQSELERFTGRVNTTFKATDRIDLGANIQISGVNQFVNSEGGVYTSPLYATRNTVTPSNAAYNPDGSYATWFPRNGDRNPKSTRDLNFDKESVFRLYSKFNASYAIAKGLKFNSSFSYDRTYNKGTTWDDPLTSDGMKDNGISSKVYDEYYRRIFSNNLSYETTFRDVHNFEALIAYETDERKSDYLSGTTKNFVNPILNEIGNGSIYDNIGGASSMWRMISYISKFNYNYNNKYFFGFSLRRDGSSRLHEDSRWGNFWSLSGAWYLTKEDFMDPFKEIISNAKLRASYGVNATLPSTYTGFMNLYSVGEKYNSEPGIAETRIADRNLTWESNYNLNLGLDFSLFKRLDFVIEWYRRETKDLLIDVPVSMTSGYSTYLTNMGEVLNSGIELEIRSSNIVKDNFNWNTSLFLSQNRNEIVRLDGIQTEIISGSQIRKVGKSYYTYYLKEFAGVNPDNGKPQFYTNNRVDGKLTKDITENPDEANYITMGSAEPNITGGISNSLRYKMFDLSFLFTYSLGGYSYDNAAQKLDHGGSEPDANIQRYYRDRWKKPGDKTSIEVFIVDNPISMMDIASSRRLHSTDHLRLKNVTFGVTLPERWTSKVGFTKARAYFSGSNLFTWAAYDNYDPEVPANGSVYFEAPQLKTWVVGLELNF